VVDTMTITDPSVDDLAGICLPLASREVRRILDLVGPEDLNACEMVALLAVLRPAYQRVQAVEAQPVSLKLVASAPAGGLASNRLSSIGFTAKAP
jgi:hypothetical protein